MKDLLLSAAQQDYLEAVYVLLQRSGQDGARVTDIAAELGTRPPTVVRGLARLREAGLVQQEERRLVRLTPTGAALAAQLLHRHTDVVMLLADVLGVPRGRAESEACVIEHGLSGDTAQRLHQFLERWQRLSTGERRALNAKRTAARGQFTLVGDAAGSGARQ
ncbi:MAG: metal-dependent transcriptional regulator [bacterium]|nr:metal-dependent transcriptional regulator [bacterium]